MVDRFGDRVREALAGRRFFITGATGFLGTALVERILRTVPDSEVVLLIRPGAGPRPLQRADPGDPEERLLRPAPRRARGPLRRRDRGRGSPRSPATSGRTGWASTTTGSGALSRLRRRRALGGHRQLRRAARHRGRGQPARPVPGGGCRRGRTRAGRRRRADRAGPLPPGLDGLRGRHPPGRGRRGAPRRQPVHASRWTGASEVAAARRQRGDIEAESRRPEPLARFTKEARERARTRPDSTCSPSAPSSCARTGSSARWSSSGEARAQSLGWPDAYPYTKALGERALVSQFGDVAPDDHRPALDHRVGPGRAPARVDPRLPDGRADHRVLRPGPAPRVPRRPRGRSPT